MQELFRELGTEPSLSIEDHERLFETDWLNGGAGLVLECGTQFCGYGWARPTVWNGQPCVHMGLALRRGFRTRGTHDIITQPLLELVQDIGRRGRIPRAVIFCRSIDTAHPSIFRNMGFSICPLSMIGFRHDLSSIPVRPAPPDVVLRTASLPDDIAAITALSGRTFTDRELQGEPITASYLEFESQRAGFKPEQVMLVEAGDELIGYCVLFMAHDERRMNHDIAELAVAPQFQHRGIGTTLVSQALLWMRAQGDASALVSTYSTNPASVLYWRMGFRPDPLRTYYFHTRTIDNGPETGVRTEIVR
jgi:ribosomal protein S18 acetylase RimI-like enzyme